MTLDLTATDYWGQLRAESLDITSARDAERALQRVYQYIPRPLLTTLRTVVRDAAAPTRRSPSIEALDNHDHYLPVIRARERSNENCGYGDWWLDHDNLYLGASGLVSIRARGTWRNYGHPSGTDYACEDASAVHITVTPEAWEHMLVALRAAVAAHNEARKRVEPQARRLLAALAETIAG